MDSCKHCGKALKCIEGRKKKQFCDTNCRNKYAYAAKKTTTEPQKGFTGIIPTIGENIAVCNPPAPYEAKKGSELKAALGVMFFDHKGDKTGYVLGTDPYRKEGEEQAPPGAVSVEKKIEDLLYRPDSAQAQKEAFTDLIDTGQALTLVTPDKVERIAQESPEARKFDGISRISNPPLPKQELDKRVAEGIRRVKAGMSAVPVRSFRDYMDLIKEGKFDRDALRKEVQEDKKLTPAQKSMLYAKLQ